MKSLFIKRKLQLPKVLSAPEIPSNISSKAKWLSGEGAGSWFVFEKKDKSHYLVSRFSPTGSLECKESFKNRTNFKIDEYFDVTYPSHCSIVTVIQQEITYTFNKY